MQRIIILSLALLLTHVAQAQLYNNGATLSIGTGGVLQVNHNLTNKSGSNLVNNGALNIKGNLTNEQTMSAANSGTLTLEGTTAQTVSGTTTYLAKNVTFNNAAGVTISKSLKADGEVKFQNGLIAASSNSEPLAFTSNGTVSATNAPSNTSHVNGYVLKEGTGAFDFPVGDGTRFQKTGINLTANGTGIVVKYNATDAGTGTFATTGASATALASYNTQEHWDISPLSTATGTVTIYWDDYKTPTLTNVNVLKVAHKRSGNWLNESGTGTGNTSAGSVTSSSLSTWSPFTLGSVPNCTNPSSYNVTGGGSLCAGDDGGVAINLSGSETGVSYQLKKGATNEGTAMNGTGSALNFGNQLTAGTYTVVATRTSSGCIATMTGSATITVLDLPNITINVTNNCGNSVLSVTPPLGAGGTYLWSNAATTADITVSSAGAYSVTATGTGNCKSTSSAVAALKVAPTANAGADVILTCTSPSATLTATGGGTYTWNNSATQGETVSPSVTTTYTVTVTAANNCTATASKIVTVDKTAPTANAGANATINCTTPSTTLTATGGGSFVWNNGATQNDVVTPSSTTTYTVTVTATNGCTATASKIVTVDKTAPTANAGADATVTCASPSTTLMATGNGGFAWNNGATQGGSVSPSTTTTYTVTVTAANGCTASDAVLVTSNKNTPSLNAGADVSLNCTSPSATLFATGTGTFSWNNGASQSATVSPSVTTVYSVTLTSASNSRFGTFVTKVYLCGYECKK